jgi:hypothetical protein
VDSQTGQGSAGDSGVCRYSQRALNIWPRLDRRALSRCACDPERIARVVARRTSLPVEAIVWLITRPSVTSIEVETWFG